MAALLVPSPPLIVGPRGFRKPARPVLDPNDPINRGLLGCWLLGDVLAGNVPDISGRGNNGAITGGPLAYAASHHGGLATSFSGSPQHIDTGIAPPTQGAVSIWSYNTNAFNSGTVNSLCGAGIATSVRQFQMMHYLDNNIYFGFAGVAGTPRFSAAATSANWPTSTWTHYLLRWLLNTSVELFINGVSQGTNNGSNTSLLTAADTFLIARELDGYGVGRRDAVRLFSRYPSVSDIQRLYAEPYAGIYEAGPRWRVGVAAAGGTFNPGWASGATRTIGMGVF